MAYTSRDRDRARLAVAGVTAFSTVGALTAAGWLAGVTISEVAASQPTPGGADTSSPRSTPRRDLPERPYVTRVTLRYVRAAVAVPVAPAPGGSVTSVPSGSSGSSGPSDSSGSSGSTSGSSGPWTPPPAPSSGS